MVCVDILCVENILDLWGYPVEERGWGDLFEGNYGGEDEWCQNGVPAYVHFLGLSQGIVTVWEKLR